MIEYRLLLDDGSELRFEVDPARAPASAADADAPEWTRLGHHQCETCPLDERAHPRCPAAVDVAPILEAFKDTVSFHQAEVRVRTPEREFVKRCDLQSAVHSLLGLVMATSGCPLLRRFRPMAFHHLPFANREETTFRTVATYLLRQYFVAKDGGVPDLELAGLKQLYVELQEVNRAFTERIRDAARRDTNLNAVVILFTLSVLVSVSLDAELASLRELFED